MSTPAVLALEDGSLFHGTAIGAAGTAAGEVVFNTAMTGYQEILTDPSYYGQLVTLTYPHIGNVGANAEDAESAGVKAAGLILRDSSMCVSNWRSEQSLEAYLRGQNVVAIADIDTRRLTRLLRQHGAQGGAIAAGDRPVDELEREALAAARAFPGLQGRDLVRDVSTARAYDWQQGSWGGRPRAAARFRVLAYDYGVKHNILRLLHDIGCELTVLPAGTPAGEVLAERPDGVFLSNGPGDPEPLDYAIENIREVLASDTPTFGICLGHQLLGLAAGGRTEKMKVGHHGANHPVLDLEAQRVMISSQNHGFALADRDLPASLQVTHRSLFDDTIQGVRHTEHPAFGFQGHPEASPGPHDIRSLFDRFVKLMQARRG
ncbi:MAG: glutamine-hydrolyzing carbamoyl-phosphate synthase small subunit [Pseudomonadota bacterium]|nr:glutamine-hydrolyzing carbamoyl-phosphate synthase small subunit [Pseudomonadota bacterium]